MWSIILACDGYKEVRRYCHSDEIGLHSLIPPGSFSTNEYVYVSVKPRYFKAVFILDSKSKILLLWSVGIDPDIRIEGIL
jgi:hypothetical protein